MEKRVRKNIISDDLIILGKRIQFLIKAKELKPREVAHYANLDVENLKKYIKGKQEMKISSMLKMA